MSISASVIADSLSPRGHRLTTFVLEYHRYIHSELLTHRCFSKNAASSRALPIEKMIEAVLTNPAIPTHWGKHQSGMQAQEELDDTVKHIPRYGCEMGFDPSDDTALISTRAAAKRTWLGARDSAVAHVRTLQKLGLAKQVANRILEPFFHIRIILSGTEFSNFFALRAHPDAQPEIQALAYLMLERYNESTPKKLAVGEWHIPFGDQIDMGRLYEAAMSLPAPTGRYEEDYDIWKRKIAIARCARISYLNFEGKDDYAADIKLCDRLFGSIPRHCFDQDTEVLTDEGFIKFPQVTDSTKVAWVNGSDGKFNTFAPVKDSIVISGKHEVYHYTGDDIDLKITSGHRLYVHRILSSLDRQGALNMTLIEANAPNVSRSPYKTVGEAPIKMVSKTFGSTTQDSIISSLPQYQFGQLCGFFIGDGYVTKDGTKSKIYFRLKKGRKIQYLSDAVAALNGDCESSDDLTYRVSLPSIAGLVSLFSKLFLNEGGFKTINRSIFTCNQQFVDGLFDGLKNSDGSVKRNTWVYGTSSVELKDRLIELGALFGYALTVSYIKTPDNDNQNIAYVLNVQTKDAILCNDSRKANRVKITQEIGTYYCVNIDGNVLITRRNGKIVLSGNCSPAEHVAQCLDSDEFVGNFRGFKQFRYTFADQNLSDPRIKP